VGVDCSAVGGVDRTAGFDRSISISAEIFCRRPSRVSLSSHHRSYEKAIAMQIPTIPAPGPEEEAEVQRYQRRSQTPQPMHLFASVGAIAIGSIVLDFLERMPIGVAPVLAIAGVVGFVSHTAYLYYTDKFKQSLQWILWAQACLLIAAAITLAGGSK
jgi:hypothetical protein